MTAEKALADIRRHVIVHTSATNAQIARRIPLKTRCESFGELQPMAGCLTRRRRRRQRR